jgi:hypothetical protein
MPQIMCPNCGTTINLENRKETDFDLIKNVTKKEPRTFTELLHLTRLSRKTLSLRLKELCGSGILVKNDGTYCLNGGIPSDNDGGSIMRSFTKFVHDKRVRTGLMLTALLILSSTSGYVLATFIIPKETHHEPVIIGAFTRTLDINNVVDLCAWQVAITFNPSEMRVLEVASGGFLGDDYPFFLNETDMCDGLLLLGGFLLGDVLGKSGSGTLATIIFGYYINEYQEPKIAFNEKTYMLDSKDSLIPENWSLTLTSIKK